MKAFKFKAFEVAGSKSELKVVEKTVTGISDYEIVAEVITCGICHSDLHMMKDEWGSSNFPFVPGHEVIGRVIEIGTTVKRHKVGDLVSVSFLCESCGECRACVDKQENYCNAVVQTCGGTLSNGRKSTGGWARNIIVHEKFAAVVPANVDVIQGAPLSCAGLTVFNPLYSADLLRPDVRVGIVGFGGLGQLAASMLDASKATVVVFDNHDGIRKLADEFNCYASCHISTDTVTDFDIIRADGERVLDTVESLDAVLLTAPITVGYDKFIELLKPTGILFLIGIPQKDTRISISPNPIIFKGRQIRGTLTGSIEELEHCHRFCSEHNIRGICEVRELSFSEDGAKELNSIIDDLEAMRFAGRVVLMFKD